MIYGFGETLLRKLGRVTCVSASWLRDVDDCYTAELRNNLQLLDNPFEFDRHHNILNS